MTRLMPTDRTDFLREYYRLLTDDIRRNEAIVPKVCAIESVFVILLVMTRWWHGPVYLVASLVLVTSTWAMHQLLNANLWAQRSHLMATNVELEFFAPTDIELLLPRSYYLNARTYRYRRVFRAPLLLSAAFFVVGLTALPRVADLRSFGFLTLAAVLACSVYLTDRKCMHEYTYLVSHAPGRAESVKI